jgi:hypothetical protein
MQPSLHAGARHCSLQLLCQTDICVLITRKI